MYCCLFIFFYFFFYFCFLLCFFLYYVFFFFFFFQAEDGIRDATVTGVQTCALPICCFSSMERPCTLLMPGNIPRIFSSGPIFRIILNCARKSLKSNEAVRSLRSIRSEERRVGKECRSGWWADSENENEVSVERAARE